jgi:hypothetical protein
MRKTILISLTVVGILICFISTINVIYLFPRTLQDHDLQWEPKKVNDNENAFIVLLPALKKANDEKLKDQLQLFREEKGQYIDFNKHKDVFEKSLPYITAFSKAMTFDVMQFPPVYLPVSNKDVRPINDKLISLLALVETLEYSYIKKLMANGDIIKASLEMMKLLKYGYLLQDARSDAVASGLAAMYFKTRTLNIIKEFAGMKNIDSSLCKELIQAVLKYSDNSSIADSLKAEYTANIILTRSKYERELKNNPDSFSGYKKNHIIIQRHGLVYNENATFNEVAKYFRRHIKNITGKYRDITPSISYLRILRHTPSFLINFSGNPIGKIEYMRLCYIPDSFTEGKFVLDAKTNLTILLLALRAYYADNQTLPLQISELVPKYASSIPEDPFDNKPLRYILSKKIIYSVGPDMKENGGDKEKDIAIDLNFAQKKE